MVDLRSDTLTLPDQAMLETILTAKLGDDGRVDASGRGEDLAVNELEDLAAELTGKEAALLFPTGTMGNTCGVLTWANSGDKILVHEQQHLLLTEKFLYSQNFFSHNFENFSPYSTAVMLQPVFRTGKVACPPPIPTSTT